MTADLRDLALDHLDAHPDNPRLGLRDDVIDQLAAEIGRFGFGSEHALLVRPVNGSYQIISGHHRHAAAARAGLPSVPCWVREMDDDEAFMQLVLANTQGELSPLEIGMHALKAVPLAGGGRGKRGGLSEYADRIGRSKERISHLRSAAEVAETVSLTTRFGPDLLDRAQHLYEVSKAPGAAWSGLVEGLVSGQWTVADTARKVSEVKRFAIPGEHAAWLPSDEVIHAYLSTGRPTPDTVSRLVSTIAGVLEHIDRDGIPSDREAFTDWLAGHVGDEAWDHRAISRYHADLIVEWSERDAESADGRLRIYESRCADLIDHLEPGSVDLIFTDPPYPVEFVECWTELGDLAVKALRPGGLILAYTGQYTMLEAIDRLRAAGLDYFWCHAVVHDGAFFRMNATHVQVGWKPVLVFRNGPGDPPNWHKDVVTDGSREKGEHEWQQSEAEAAYWISELSKPDDLVVDPFVGGGTTPAVCQQLGRRFIGCDIDSEAVERSRKRVES